MTEVKKKLNTKQNQSCDRDTCNLLAGAELCDVNIDVLSREEAEEVEAAPLTAFITTVWYSTIFASFYTHYC